MAGANADFAGLAGGDFLVEIVRINPRFAFGLSEAQFISLGIMAIAAVQIWRSSGPEVADAASASAPEAGRRVS